MYCLTVFTELFVEHFSGNYIKVAAEWLITSISGCAGTTTQFHFCRFYKIYDPDRRQFITEWKWNSWKVFKNLKKPLLLSLIYSYSYLQQNYADIYYILELFSDIVLNLEWMGLDQSLDIYKQQLRKIYARM